jgi:hypothetical protein
MFNRVLKKIYETVGKSGEFKRPVAIVITYILDWFSPFSIIADIY